MAPGERSAKVYLTNLFNRALPLIRYEITDEVTILNEPCPCGSAHRCVADIQGRLDDVFSTTVAAFTRMCSAPRSCRHAGVVEYQVRQTPEGRVGRGPLRGAGGSAAARRGDRARARRPRSERPDVEVTPWSGWSAIRAPRSSDGSCPSRFGLKVVGKAAAATIVAPWPPPASWTSNRRPELTRCRGSATHCEAHGSAEQRVPGRAGPPRRRRAPARQSDRLIERIRSSVIGDDAVLEGPFGPRRMVYADATASGRALAFIEDFIRDQVLPVYGNTHTEASATGLRTTRLREEARAVIHGAVNGADEDVVIFCGSGATGAIDKLIRLLELRPRATARSCSSVHTSTTPTSCRGASRSPRS